MHLESAFDFQTFDFWTAFSYTTGEMLPFQERKKIRKFLYSKVTLFILFVLVSFLAQKGWVIHKKAEIARAERIEAKKDLEDLQNRIQTLEASLAQLRSDKGIEQELRQKFTVARPGEEVVVVVDAGDKKSKNSEGEKEGFFQGIVSFFGF